MKERKLGLLGRKMGMTTVFDERGQALGVTVVELGPCQVLARRTIARDGYNALVLGFGRAKASRVNKPQAGELKAVGGADAAPRWRRELRVSAQTAERFEVGQQIKVSDLELDKGAWVDVQGRSIGKGFQGVMKRHNFAGFRATHGTHEYFRHGGSIGCRKWPGRVFPGRKMPGQMGNAIVTTQNLTVVQVRAEDDAVLLLGSVPGAVGGQVILRPAIKRHPLP